jgi:glycosyltransferase involved in cell wall biosynthesis
LTQTEEHRVLAWGTEDETAPGESPASPALVVPWRTVTVLLETPPRAACERLAGLAQYSGNAVVAVGYDCIPVVSADLVPLVEADRFAHYLSTLKFVRRIAAISTSAAAEFGGFGAALPAQGIPSPRIVECRLPDVPPALASEGPGFSQPPSGRKAPLVLCVGLEPRKNPLGLLYAAERLWRDHLDFDLLFVAGSGWGDEALQRIDQLRTAGRPISVVGSLTEAELASVYRRAAFTVFVSWHEGFGLPLAESLALGTPVVTTGYGSTREIAAAGGALLVDPRDDDSLVGAMGRLITDAGARHALRQQIPSGQRRSWEQYAADLWEHLVEPEFRTTRGQKAST